MKDETLEDLMPTINPNLDEVVEGNITLVVEEPPVNDEIFICKTLKKPTKLQEPIKEEDPQPPLVSKKYPHLEKARANALLTRQKKAREKAELKALEKAEKLKIKEEKKKLRIEKNRTNARNNYHKKKEQESKDKEDQVFKESITDDKFMPIKTGLSYDEFEKYMDTYTRKKIQTRPKPIIKPKPVRQNVVVNKPQVNKPQVIQSIHPIGYYNPHQRNKIDMDDLFSL